MSQRLASGVLLGLLVLMSPLRYGFTRKDIYLAFEAEHRRFWSTFESSSLPSGWNDHPDGSFLRSCRSDVCMIDNWVESPRRWLNKLIRRIYAICDAANETTWVIWLIQDVVHPPDGGIPQPLSAADLAST